jgi:hypothetical protein
VAATGDEAASAAAADSQLDELRVAWAMDRFVR